LVLGRLVGGGVGKSASGGRTGGGWRGGGLSVSADDFEVEGEESEDDDLQLEVEDDADRALMDEERA